MILLARLLAFSALVEAAWATPAARVPVLVELFTSEGCSSCPSADAVLAELAQEQPIEGVLIVPLSLHVDYWDRLGWRDPFSDPLFSARQHGYSDSSGRRYTPQMVVDGKRRFIGSADGRAREAIAAAATEPKSSATISAERLSDGRVHFTVEIEALRTKAGEVLIFLAIAEDELASQVRRGENAGRRLEHAAVCRLLNTIGSMRGDGFQGELAVSLEGKASNTTAIAFAQETTGERRVLALGLLQLDSLPDAR